MTSRLGTADRVHTTGSDLLELEIFRHVVSAIVGELEVNLTRTAYSPLVYEYKDYCTGVLTDRFELLAQSEGTLPVFLADLGGLVRDSVEVIGAENLKPGDIFLSNYAPVNGTHINNVTCATPIFRDAEIIAYIAIRAHWADVGGLVPGSISWNAREIYHEGVQLRGVRIVREGRIEPEILATIQANTRMPEYVTGDLMAQIAACVLGVERWNSRVAPHWTPEQFRGLVEQQAQESRAYAAAALRKLPEGEYQAACRLDDAGIPGSDPLPLSVRLHVHDGRMEVDFSDLPPQTTSPINAGRNGGANTVAKLAFKQLFAPQRMADEWLFDSLDVTIPDGTFMSADGTAPMGWWNTAPATLIDLIFRAIGEQHPELVPAGHHSTMGCWLCTGIDERGQAWMCLDTALGGFGAHAEGDGYGPLKTLGHGDNRDIPIELLESRYPLRVLSYGLRRDSAGSGLHRGGFGTEKVLEVLSPFTFECSMDRTLDPPWGLAGGMPGQPGDIEIKEPGESEWRSVKKASSLLLGTGTLIRIKAAGGGGWGVSAASEATPSEIDLREEHS